MKVQLDVDCGMVDKIFPISTILADNFFLLLPSRLWLSDIPKLSKYFLLSLTFSMHFENKSCLAICDAIPSSGWGHMWA